MDAITVIEVYNIRTECSVFHTLPTQVKRFVAVVGSLNTIEECKFNCAKAGVK